MNSVEEEVRKMAIEDAKKKAEKLAGDLGVSLVRIVSFYEDNGLEPKMMYSARSADESMMLGMGGDAGSTNAVVPVGENRLVSNVNITYEIR
jgi:uncharacterized protein YggE